MSLANKRREARVLSQIPSLPPEIIRTICNNADIAVLGCLRLVSKQLCQYAEPVLFSLITLRVAAHSFERLDAIASSAKLRKHVRVLHYDGRLLPWDLNRSEWEDLTAKQPGWTVYGHNDKPMWTTEVLRLLQLTSDEKEFFHRYEEYSRRLAEQKDLHRGEEEIERLTNAFRRLPKLDTLYFDSGLWSGPEQIFIPDL